MWKAGGRRPSNLLWSLTYELRAAIKPCTANPHAARLTIMKIENKCSPGDRANFGNKQDAIRIGAAANASC